MAKNEMIDTAALDRDIRKLSKTFDRMSIVLGRDRESLIKQTAIFAVQSAVKATGPGKSGKVSKLPKKFKFRPLVKIPETSGYFYTQDGENIFRTSQPINVKAKRNKDRGIKRITKGIKMWNKKTKGFTYLPYIGAKRDESDRRFKIPFAGSAKVGWLKSLNKLDKKPVDIGENKRSSKRFGRVTRRPGLIEIVNLVSYAAKISPQSARIGLAKASRRLDKIMQAAERNIERDWRKTKRTFLRSF